MALSEKLKIVAEDGYELAAQIFNPSGVTQRKTVIIASATGVRKEFYSKFSSYFAERGIRVVTFDYRGIGESLVGDLKNSPASMVEWGQFDVTAVISWVQTKFPQDSIYFIGHSIGAHVLGLAKNANKINGVILIASACAYWRNYGFFYRQIMWMTYFIIFPLALKVLKYFPSKILRKGDDLPPNIARNWGHWGTQQEYLFSEYPQAKEHLSQLNVPVLAYSFKDDWITPPVAVRQLLDSFPNKAKQWSHLSPRDVGVKHIGHIGFFRRQLEKTLWSDTFEWVHQHR